MALPKLLLLLFVGGALSLTFFSEAGEVGVCYGMMGDNLPQPPAVVQLLKQHGITMVRLYDADAGGLRALANTGIKVGVSLPNDNIPDAASSMSYAVRWVQSNVQAYPGTWIDSVAVGNEVFHQAPWLTHQLLPAMKNIQAALAGAGLGDAVKVVTPIALDALKVPSFPPSVGEFRDDIAWSVMRPMVDFLEQTGSYLTFNIYPYFAYKYDSHVDPDFAFFRPNNGQHDPGTGLTYFNLFDAMVDAVFHAVEKLGNSGEHTHGNGRTRRRVASLMRVPESGAPGGKGKTGVASNSKLDGSASTENAQAYNSNLIRKVLSGAGTPYNPDADISVYIFSLFNENLKPGDDDERNFGLFYPNGTQVYDVNFTRPGPGPGPGGPSWCVANAAVGDRRLQDALDYACGNGADCSGIQAGGWCFEPNTRVAHASYAFNDYYQRNGRSVQSCDFGGCGSVVYQQPSFGNCVLPQWRNGLKRLGGGPNTGPPYVHLAQG
ncbi:hypothetical protein CFC21_067146 [Triticum aestivum]|uniref:X8 domain-containing protein n=3 Tax=Triticum TaxID=4564 RepID=A0A9R0TV63_TRITD|nr:glucan endo-1,3-beta-glucosidase GV-like isoform X3 [Triticum aestivum]KAF7060354.1 hypothetical protein CFC21_067146 [Triticum aestivum]VAI20650.1 unnamed protein product [Triticum turgidum subsp. durum]